MPLKLSYPSGTVIVDSGDMLVGIPDAGKYIVLDEWINETRGYPDRVTGLRVIDPSTGTILKLQGPFSVQYHSKTTTLLNAPNEKVMLYVFEPSTEETQLFAKEQIENPIEFGTLVGNCFLFCGTTKTHYIFRDDKAIHCAEKSTCAFSNSESLIMGKVICGPIIPPTESSVKLAMETMRILKSIVDDVFRK